MAVSSAERVTEDILSGRTVRLTKNTAGICTFCPVLGDAAPQQQDGSEYQQIFFHSRKNLKKGLKGFRPRGTECQNKRAMPPSSTFCVTGVSQSATVTDTAQS